MAGGNAPALSNADVQLQRETGRHCEETLLVVRPCRASRRRGNALSRRHLNIAIQARSSRVGKLRRQ